MIKNEDIDDGQLYQKLHKVSWCAWLCPPETILPCNLLFHPCRKAVSRKKRRYQKDGFDLDLVYLSPRIIVHGFPAVGLEHIYRNPRYEIKRLLELRHADKFKVFNFCCEPGRGYSASVFNGRSERYPFKDHNTPPLETVAAFANSAKCWLDQDPQNVCSLHCKAGKGRAGLMSCVLLIRSGVCDSAKEALDHYDRERVTNNRGLTVTSQRKYVIFYERLWRDHWGVKGRIGDIPGEAADSTKWKVPEQPTISIYAVEILDVPSNLLKNIRIRIFKGSNFKPELKFDSGKGHGYKLSFSCDTNAKGNFKIEVVASKGVLGSAVKVLELWHNTLFMNKNDPFVDFDKNQLDIKKSFRSHIGEAIKLRVHLVKDTAITIIDNDPTLPRVFDTSHKAGYEVVKRSEEMDLTVVAL